MGHPDAQDIALWIGDALLTEDGVQPPAVETELGGFRVEAWAGLQVYCLTAGVLVRLHFEWYSDDPAQGGQFCGERFWSVAGAHALSTFESNLGAFVVVSWLGSAAAGTVDLVVAPSNQQPIHSAITKTHRLVNVLDQNVVAGATNSQTLLPYRGLAWCWFETSAAAFTTVIEGAEHDGTLLYRLLNYASPAQPFDKMIYLAPKVHTFKFHNLDAGARVYSIVIIDQG